MYAELSITSNFTFLTGASHPEEYMQRAAWLDIAGIAIADDNSVAGIVRAHTEGRAIARKLQERRDWWVPVAQRLTRRFGKGMHLLLTPLYDGRDRARFDELASQAAGLGLRTLASAAPRVHHGNRRRLADVLCAIRLHRKVDGLGRDALANGEARLRGEVERAGALARTLTFRWTNCAMNTQARPARTKPRPGGWRGWRSKGWTGAILRARLPV